MVGIQPPISSFVHKKPNLSVVDGWVAHGHPVIPGFIRAVPD